MNQLAPRFLWSELIDELRRIRNLPDDWDGEETEAPYPSLVDGAITLAQHLQGLGVAPADRVLASVNGTIYFEWYSRIDYREIEVTSPHEAELRYSLKHKDSVEFERLFSWSLGDKYSLAAEASRDENIVRWPSSRS